MDSGFDDKYSFIENTIWALHIYHKLNAASIMRIVSFDRNRFLVMFKSKWKKVISS